MADIVVNSRITIPESELTVSFSRSGGPGGQNVNKVETKVTLRWRPKDSVALSKRDQTWLLNKLRSKLTTEGDIIITSSKTRAREQNRTDAYEKLAELVRTSLVRPKKRKPTRPTRNSVKRRLAAKQRQSDKKRNRRKPSRDD